MSKGELLGYAVLNIRWPEGWLAKPTDAGEMTGDGAHTSRLLSRLEAEDLAERCGRYQVSQGRHDRYRVVAVYSSPHATVLDTEDSPPAREE